MKYQVIKKVLIWIPIIGFVMVLFEKNLKSKSMYDEFFDYGSPLLVIVSAFWHAIPSAYLLAELIS